MKRLTVVLAVLLLTVFTSGALGDFINTTGPTGTYYQYGIFPASSSSYRGGGDVDSYGDTIYVNRDGTNLDVYTVTLADTDGDSAYEPDQHPDNPAATGPIEARTLTYVKSYSVPKLDSPTAGEIYAAADRIYFLTEGNAGISEYIFATDVTNTVVNSPYNKNLSLLGYDDVNDKWYASSESPRTVYSWNGTSWVSEFSYVSLAGSHMDGLEVVTDPDTNVPYVYVSDMTSDYLGQWRYDSTTSAWVENNLFQYNDITGGYVEGMGFSALGHFWATTGFSNSGTLYEIGGGELGGYIPPPPEDDEGVVPEPSTFIIWSLLAVIGIVWSYRR